jgi:hypothetical protein
LIVLVHQITQSTVHMPMPMMTTKFLMLNAENCSMAFNIRNYSENNERFVIRPKGSDLDVKLCSILYLSN